MKKIFYLFSFLFLISCVEDPVSEEDDLIPKDFDPLNPFKAIYLDPSFDYYYTQNDQKTVIGKVVAFTENGAILESSKNVYFHLYSIKDDSSTGVGYLVKIGVDYAIKDQKAETLYFASTRIFPFFYEDQKKWYIEIYINENLVSFETKEDTSWDKNNDEKIDPNDKNYIFYSSLNKEISCSLFTQFLDSNSLVESTRQMVAIPNSFILPIFIIQIKKSAI